MKKCFLILLFFLLGTVLLAGCSCEHAWVEATCTEPKICTKCGLTEGQALGHSWVAADCTTAKTCSRCAATEGTALEHSWVDATCTAPKTCSLCAATEGQPLEHTWVGEATLYESPSCAVCGIPGEPLPGYLAQQGLKPNVFPGTAADYITGTYVRPDLDTTGLLTVSELQIFSHDSTHQARSGYEWRRVDISIVFNDNRFYMYGARIAYTRADYYQDLTLKQPGKQEQFPVTYQDQEYWCRAFYQESGFSYENGSSIFRMTVHVQVPEGYDGVVLAFHRGTQDITGKHLHEVEDENLLLLRMA